MLEIVIALLTILAPILSVGVVAWAENVKQNRQNRQDEDTDDQIKKIAVDDAAGYLNLSLTLERLRREARRKTGHPGQS